MESLQVVTGPGELLGWVTEVVISQGFKALGGGVLLGQWYGVEVTG